LAALNETRRLKYPHAPNANQATCGVKLMEIYSTSQATNGDERPYWNRAIHDIFDGMQLHYDDDKQDFSGKIVSRQLGQLQLSHTTSSHPHHSIRRDRPSQDYLWLCFVQSGHTYITHRDHAAELAQGDFVLLDTTAPTSLDFSGDFEGLWIGAPGAALECKGLALHKVLGCRIDGNSGAAYVASKMLEAVPSQLPTLDDRVAMKLCNNLLDTVSTALGSTRSDSISTALPPRRAILQRIQSFIEAHLHEDTLTPVMIAKEHGISLRYLNKLFEQEGLSVARQIWIRRLDSCRVMLENPLQMNVYISNIAYSCGFNNISHFNRAFKTRFGCSPSAYRKLYHTADRTGAKPN
jgi:AraC-like DNA-binding protein